MKRTKHSETSLLSKDCINKSTKSQFTQIPNQLLRNPEISCKAKTVLCILLSNNDGWKSHLVTLTKMMKESEPTIRYGLRELQQHGYLVQARYREKDTKKIKGSIWIYTDSPFQFESIEDITEEMDKKGLEFHPGDDSVQNLYLKNPNKENPYKEKANKENFGLRIPNNKNTKNKNKNVSPPSRFKKQYVSLSNRLQKIISSHKKINVNTTPSDWWKPIQKLVENKLNNHTVEARILRVKKALDFYEQNIGGPYIPVIESGNSLYEKFSKLENAIERNTQDEKPSFKPKPGQRYQERQSLYDAGYDDQLIEQYGLDEE